MNKYQEALDALNFMADDSFALAKLYHDSKEEHKKLLKSKNVCYFALQELVDKATPVKPDDYKNLGFVLCGTYVIKMKTGKCKCGHPVNLLQLHCPCGQALDWTDNE